MAHLVSAVNLYYIHHHYKKYLCCLCQGIASEVGDRLYNEYVGNAKNRAEVRDGLFDALGDAFFVLSSIEVARYHRGMSLIQHLLKEMCNSRGVFWTV